MEYRARVNAQPSYLSIEVGPWAGDDKGFMFAESVTVSATWRVYDDEKVRVEIGTGGTRHSIESGERYARSLELATRIGRWLETSLSDAPTDAYELGYWLLRLGVETNPERIGTDEEEE